ncbi:MAG: sulfate adenylyltransferase, partial [Actinomycetota bacterium]|nr:sulfate adenylyltransferase [Actinomycetota bacterium]
NKMDLVDWDEDVYETIKDDFRAFATRLDVADVTFVPMSALRGDNVVERSANMPWYPGLPLLTLLEQVHIASDRNLIDGRFPVQYVIRPHTDSHHDYRGYAGQVAGGVFRPGEEIIVLPSGMTSTIEAIDTCSGPVDRAYPPMSVALRLADDVDVSRGDMICRPRNQPEVGQDVEAMICWLTDRPLEVGGRYTVKHTTRSARAVVRDLRYRIDINTLHRDEHATTLGLNEIGRVTLRTAVPLMWDEYRRNRATGSFILIDEATNATTAGGMILGAHGAH